MATSLHGIRYDEPLGKNDGRYVWLPKGFVAIITSFFFFKCGREAIF